MTKFNRPAPTITPAPADVVAPETAPAAPARFAVTVEDVNAPKVREALLSARTVAEQAAGKLATAAHRPAGE